MVRHLIFLSPELDVRTLLVFSYRIPGFIYRTALLKPGHRRNSPWVWLFLQAQSQADDIAKSVIEKVKYSVAGKIN
ncbi:MAG TPA: hypothetical protein VJA94_07745 [Candidatus Angelobacter sp.]